MRKGYFDSIRMQFWTQINADYKDLKYKELT